MDWEKLLGKLPDVYFDWYARFLPGSVAIFAYFVITKTEFPVNVSGLVLWGFLAYLAGHVIQPIVGIIVKHFETRIRKATDAKCTSNLDSEKIYKHYKNIGAKNAMVAKASKAHAEANSALASSLLLVIIGLLTSFSPWLCVAIVAFFGGAIERAFARRRKIADMIDSSDCDSFLWD